MSKRFHKHKLLLDEHMSPRQEYQTLNHDFDVKHIRDDFKKDGAKDPVVLALAFAERRIVVTANGKDFRALVTSTSPGVIDVPADWTEQNVDTKLTALLKKHGPSYFAGQYRTLATE